jgi:hypothetical protein
MPTGIRIHNHKNALEILQNRLSGLALKELAEFWHRMPLIRFEGKSEKTPSLEFLQTCMNPLINYVLKCHYGWHAQVDLPGGTKGNNIDFYKKFDEDLRVWMEVEFANSARIDTDIRKLRAAFMRGLSDVGILVVCTDELAASVDRNIATFETAREIILSEQCNDFPCLIIGIERNPAKIVDVTQWGYALELLKGEHNQETKSEVAARIWTDLMQPTLPQDSMHAQHLGRVQILGFNPGLHKPTLPDLSEEVGKAPDVLTWNEDGSLSTFQEEAKVPRSRERAASKATSNSRLAFPLEPAPEASREVEAAQTPFQYEHTPSAHLSVSVARPAGLEQAGSVTLPVVEVRKSTAPILVKPAITELPRKTVQVSAAAGGPRLGPWLSRAGASASPFISSFA